MLFICYKKCSTCRDVRNRMDELGWAYQQRDIKENAPSATELEQWHVSSGLPLKRFFNTSGQLYRELHLKDKLPKMTAEEQYRLLATDGMLVKRPILITDGGQVLVGADVKKYVNKYMDERKDMS